MAGYLLVFLQKRGAFLYRTVPSQAVDILADHMHDEIMTFIAWTACGARSGDGVIDALHQVFLFCL